MGNRLANDSFTSILGKRVAATRLTPMSVQPLHPGCWEVYIVLEKEVEHVSAPLASKKVSNAAFE
jgi:hypothetical protein